MKRGVLFDCKHPGAQVMYCSTFSTIQRVKLCLTCMKGINDNKDDPRGIGVTITDAVDIRDKVKHAAS